jgi:pimeloyl-ACP methyl ester carboxylesterase
MIYQFIGNKIADTVLYPVDQPFPKTPADYGINYKDVEFFARDGVNLSGWLLNETAGQVIIMTHFGYRANRFGYQTKYQPRLTKPYNHEIEFVKVAQRLVDADYAVLMYDMRNHGISGKSKLACGTGGYDERFDVLAAVEFVANHETTKGRNVGLLSYCMGLNATFYAFNEDADVFVNNNVKALVGMQPLGNAGFLKAYGIKGSIYRHADEHYKEHTGIPMDYPIVPSVEKVVTPTLLCQGRNDPWTNLDFINEVYETLPVEKEMYWMEEPTHRFDGYNWFYEHPEKMLEWFNKHL